jgi:hypothetical protein
MRPHVSGTERMGFLKQDARGNLVVASLPLNFPFSAFCQRFLVQTSVRLNTIHTFLSHKKSSDWHFLAWPRPRQAMQYSSGMESPRLFPNSWIRLIVAVLWQLPCTLLKAIVRAFLATKSFAAGSSTYPCHMECVSKSVTKNVISLSDYCPNSTEAPWMRCAIVGADHSASLSCDCQGQVHKVVLCWLLLLRKVVLFRYSLCIWLPRRKRDTGANTSNKMGCLQNPLLVNQKKGILGWGHGKGVLVRSSSVWISSFSRVEQILGKKSWRRILLSTPGRRLVRLVPLLGLT